MKDPLTSKNQRQIAKYEKDIAQIKKQIKAIENRQMQTLVQLLLNIMENQTTGCGRKK
jgi:hypothetical protein